MSWLIFAWFPFLHFPGSVQWPHLIVDKHETQAKFAPFLHISTLHYKMQFFLLHLLKSSSGLIMSHIHLSHFGCVHVRHPFAPSMSVIFHPHPWMSYIDEVSPSMDDIHWWHFHPWMRFLNPCMTSLDDTSIHGWDLLIHGWNCHLSDFAYVS